MLVEPWAEVSYGGLSGFRVVCTYTYLSERFVFAEVFLFRGTIEYEIYVHSPAEDWPRVKQALEAVCTSFRAVAV